MSFLRGISRFILGAVFILSGFFKAIDPIGGGLKIKEYLHAFHLDFFDFMSIPGSVMLSAVEFLIGVSVLKGLKMNFFSGAALGFMLFFTPLTLYSAFFNPVQDCGCFGEALHLSNWETFYKNIVLLAAALLLFFQRKKFTPIATPRLEFSYITLYAFFILSISVYALARLPQIDLGDYRAGTNLADYQESAAEKEYETVFIYAKGGKQQEFSINNLPDSTWQFVDSKTTLLSEGEGKPGAEFILKDSLEQYVGSAVLMQKQPLFFVSFYHAEKVSEKKIRRLERLKDTLAASGALLYLVSGSGPEQTGKAFEGVGVPILYSDYKTVLSFNRANGGLTYVSGGEVITKWASGNYPFESIRKGLSRDPEVLMANSVIGDQLFAEICLAIIFFMIVILRVISKWMYKRYLAQLEELEDMKELAN